MRCPAAVPALLMLTGVTVGRLGPDVAGAPLVAAVALAWVCSLSGRDGDHAGALARDPGRARAGFPHGCRRGAARTRRRADRLRGEPVRDG